LGIKVKKFLGGKTKQKFVYMLKKNFFF